LPPPKHGGGGDGSVMSAMCPDETDGGTEGGGADGGATDVAATEGAGGDDGGSVCDGGGSSIDAVITPMACAANGPNPNAIDRYSQGYTQDPNNLSRVQMTLLSMS